MKMEKFEKIYDYEDRLVRSARESAFRFCL